MSISSAVKPYTFTNGTKANASQVNSNFDTVYTGANAAIAALNNAAGSKSSLDGRLDVSMNADGTMKDDITSGGEWINPELTPTYVSAASFTVAGDHTDIYLTNRMLKITLAGGVIYRSVVTSAYVVGTDLTTVTVATGLTGPITSVEHATVSPWSSGVGSVSLAGMTGYSLCMPINIPSSIVVRDSSGNFAAGTITANLTGNVTGTASAATNADTVDGNHAAYLAPPGGVMAFARSTVPTGWLECNGAAVSRSTYINLFAAIGTTWGSGDGSTTFNLPDLRGEFIRGWDNGRGVDAGRVAGSWQDGAIISHRHIDGSRVEAGSACWSPTTTVASGQCLDHIETTTSAAPYTSYEGGTETRPRNWAMMYCIKT